MKSVYESPVMEVLLYEAADFLDQSGNDFTQKDVFDDSYGDSF